LVDFAGKDSSFFTHIFRFDQLHECAGLIGEITNTDYELPHKQSGGPKLDPSALTERQLRKIENLYKSDYRYFEEYF
jgi:hypothetical protein